MTNKESCTASSCAVVTSGDGIRLFFSFYSIGDYSSAEKAFKKNSMFEVDSGLTRKGSVLAMFSKSAHADDVFKVLDDSGLTINSQRIEYRTVETKKNCGSVKEAVTLAFDPR